ncbi:aldo keto reductase : Aldo/keto reductase OS=Nostoc sp. PCC 7107 GN=Nos7107_1307 PE=4 SV=1: Aldo_ket_red [Gemmata massiliana]|uniref:NADP-dependent oxidoreductase domain-containing protein n=1 Tax=Gemmata massiliana TaxID=1210884 RepID=A0A6P2D256_9BACT|nr:aldo/keto reductase [Gemmata massiliana]VTR94164.1 aldo keto reductase : Aldo/keto reductase OS=Nostoc sp. PCC 7107 GN=Nos7107_1307 PE=4 SV=1: Aldo_ket_red [Gemmata massiliana]
MQRREFIGAVTAAAAVLTAKGDEPKDKHPKETRRGDMLYRQLGSTKEDVSAVGLGGHHIGRQKDEKDSIAIIRAAIGAGITFMDNCWDYHDGGSEIRMGKALKDGYRKKVFLMTKIDGRTKKAAADQINESLKRLQTDVIDLVQHHEIIRMEDPNRIFVAGGAQEAVEAAKKAGKIRYIGFTGHKDPLVHLRMLEVAKEHGFKFDTAQMPLNVLDAHFRSFEKQVVPVLLKEGVGVLGMKALGDGLVLKSKTATPVECLQYALSLPTSVVITGIDSMAILKQALDVAKTFKPLTKKETTDLLAKTKQAAMKGEFERFKTTNAFDGTAKNPSWLGEHDKGPG